jgi:transposase
MINSQKPIDLGLPGEFWSPQALKQLIQQKFNVTYQSNNTLREPLHFCGFSYQKVKFQDSRKDEARTKHEKLRLEKKLKKGVLRMY